MTMIMFSFLKLIIWNIIHPLLLGIIIFKDIESDEKRIITSCLIFLAGFFNLIVLSEIPSIGIHLMMIKRVLISATKFFLSFFIVLFSFCLVFHLLLPNTPSFTRLDDAFIKICAMLMSERKKSLQKAIEGLGQHGMVGTSDEKLMNLHDALKLEFVKVQKSYVEALEQLEALALVNSKAKNSGQMNAFGNKVRLFQIVIK